MNKRIIFSLLTAFILVTSLFSATKYKILSCNPNVIEQGEQDITLNLVTNSPMPQKSNNEYLYSEIQFSNPGIHIQEVFFQNALIINCKVSLDKYVDETKPVDISIIGYDEQGNDFIYEGKKLLTIKRRPFIDKVIVHKADGAIIPGEEANITLKGYNFQSGKIGILLMWSGLPLINTACDNSRQLRFSLTAEQTKQIKPGGYSIYIYNRDGSGCQSSEKVLVS